MTLINSLELPEIYCKKCSTRITELHVVKRNKNGIYIRSVDGEISCSKSCSSSLTNYKNHRTDPNRGKKFNKMMQDKLKHDGFDLHYHNPESVRENRSKQASYDNPKWHSSHSTETRKRILQKAAEDIRRRFLGKTFEEIFGEEKAASIREKFSQAVMGEKNPMFGKPSPALSGGGFVGRYKGFHFRSLIELSFIKQTLDSEILIESAENSRFKIPYLDHNGKNRNYFPDFYLPETDTVIEIKHFRSLKEENVQLKIAEARKNFKNFVIITNQEILMLSVAALRDMIEKKEVELCERSLRKLYKV